MNKPIKNKLMKQPFFKWQVKSILLMLVFALLGLQVQAQEREIRGRVIGSDDKVSLTGVSVSVENTTIGVATNANGEYKLKVPGTNSILVFSFIGFATQKI